MENKQKFENLTKVAKNSNLEFTICGSIDASQVATIFENPRLRGSKMELLI